MIWYDVISYHMIWFDMRWYDMIWYDWYWDIIDDIFLFAYEIWLEMDSFIHVYVYVCMYACVWRCVCGDGGGESDDIQWPPITIIMTILFHVVSSYRLLPLLPFRTVISRSVCRPPRLLSNTVYHAFSSIKTCPTFIPKKLCFILFFDYFWSQFSYFFLLLIFCFPS